MARHLSNVILTSRPNPLARGLAHDGRSFAATLCFLHLRSLADIADTTGLWSSHHIHSVPRSICRWMQLVRCPHLWLYARLYSTFCEFLFLLFGINKGGGAFLGTWVLRHVQGSVCTYGLIYSIYLYLIGIIDIGHLCYINYLVIYLLFTFL